MGKGICPDEELELGEMIEEGIRREVKAEPQLEIGLVIPLPPLELKRSRLWTLC